MGSSPAGIMAAMGVVPLARHKLQLAVVVDIDELHVVVLGAVGIDLVLHPRPDAFAIHALFPPIQVVGMSSAHDEIVEPVAIHIMHENGNAGRTPQVEIRMKGPLPAIRVFGGLEPTAVQHDVRAAVARDVAKPEAVALGTSRNGVSLEGARAAALAVADQLEDAHRLAGAVWDHLDVPVAVDIVEARALDVADLGDVMDLPFRGRAARILAPAQRLSPPPAGHDVEVPVAVDIDGVIREIVVVIARRLDVADLVSLLEIGSFEPVFAGNDVQHTVVVHVEDGGRLIGHVTDTFAVELEHSVTP